MKTKHTPGPWTWFTGFKKNSAETIRETGERIRFVMGGPNDQGLAHTVGLNEETDTANAHLIAAAPELLAALQLVAALPGFEPEEPYGVATLAAIAKARGEA